MLRETLSLVVGGVAARARLPVSLGGRRLLTDSCALAVSIWALVGLAASVGLDRMSFEWSSFGFAPIGVVGFVIQGLMAISIGLALLGYDRASAVSGLSWFGVSLTTLLLGKHVVAGGAVRADALWLASHLVPLACFAVMIIAPRKTSRTVVRVVWLPTLVLIGVLVDPVLFEARWSFLGLDGIISLLTLAVAIGGMLSLIVDPQHTAMFALALMAFGFRYVVFDFAVFPAAQYLSLVVTMLIPMLLIAGVAARWVSGRRSLPS